MSTENQMIKTRILETKTSGEEIAFGKGVEAGKLWVKNNATYSELEILSEVTDAMSISELVQEITINEQDDPAYLGLDNSIDKSPFAEKFTEGFISGAIELYEEVMES